MTNRNTEGSPLKESEGTKVSDSSTHTENHQPIITKKENVSKWNINSLACLLFVSIIAFTTKFYNINQPSETSYNEVDLGLFVTSYIKQEYFIDIHPPLGKLLLGAAGYLSGYDGSFNFTRAGLSYANSTVPYVGLRSFSALCGALTIVIVYVLLVEMKFSISVAVLGVCMIAFDNAFTTQSRFMSIDAQLLLFIIMACFSWVKFRSHTNSPFDMGWWFWLYATGVCLGLALGVKYVGFFVTAIIGLCTVYDLWDVSGFVKTPKHIHVVFHWLARILCLIVVPILIFLIPFFIHLQVAYKSGSGDEYMSNEFQSSLAGNKVTQQASPVYYGSTIKIVNKEERIFLHSHRHKYPEKHEDGKVSSQGQQVTGYGHPDENNDWIILPEIRDPPIDYENGTRIVIQNKDIVRLQHVSTGKYLMTHDVASPLTGSNQEVTATDASDPSHNKYNKTLWEIKIKTQELFAQVSEFELKHKESKTTLMNQKENLPEWGYKQKEINAGKTKSTPKTTWKIERITKQRDPPQGAKEPIYEYKNKLSFWERFVEMITVPLDRKTKLSEKSPYLAAPIKWPFLDQGIHFWSSSDKTERVFLICNPLTWYLSILALPALVGLVALDLFIYLRGEKFLSSEQKRFLYPRGIFFLGCYLSHFFLFAGLGKEMYLHEYMPCYFFNILVLTTVYQVVAIRYKILSNLAVVGLVCSVFAGVFFHFSALTYGTRHTEEYFRALKLSKSWHF